ncbi:AzlD domain-containing protein [Actinophytocola sp.]|uniref:AzlD domain-containing protein n=1 Tax=Actinophytocola sp. TaxID=1872138 RepID=UPI002D7E9610|nr:AzlD domain-containing protein [Actinophytocola sp.]HET9141741.1 AzlD domain-containing protein [Actinophytocola sp.]
MSIVAVLVLAVGTYAFRVAGPLLRDRIVLPDRVRTLLSISAVVLLFALVATAAVMDGQRFAGWALPAGVLAGGVLAWRRAPFVVVVVAAAGVTAGLRLLGVG